MGRSGSGRETLTLPVKKDASFLYQKCMAFRGFQVPIRAASLQSARQRALTACRTELSAGSRWARGDRVIGLRSASASGKRIRIQELAAALAYASPMSLPIALGQYLDSPYLNTVLRYAPHRRGGSSCSLTAARQTDENRGTKHEC